MNQKNSSTTKVHSIRDDQERSKASSRSTAHTDTERIDALAEAISRLVVYETMRNGHKCKISFTSTVQKGTKKHGVKPDFLRTLADGLLMGKA